MLAAILLIGGVAAVLLTGGNPEEVAGRRPEPISGPNKVGRPDAVPPANPSNPEPPANQGPSEAEPGDKPEEAASSDPAPLEPGGTPTAEPAETADPAAGTAPDAGQGEGSGTDQSAQVPPGENPVPDAAAQTRAEQRVKEILANASAAEWLQAGRDDDRPPDERFVLLEKARDSAAASGDVEMALQAVDEIDRHFRIDVLEMKAETFIALSDTATGPATFRLLAETGLALVDQAIEEGKQGIAKRVGPKLLYAARRSEDSKLAWRVTRRFVEIQKLP